MQQYNAERVHALVENEIKRDLMQRAARAPENTEEATEDNNEQEEAAVSDDYAEDI